MSDVLTEVSPVAARRSTDERGGDVYPRDVVFYREAIAAALKDTDRASRISKVDNLLTAMVGDIAYWADPSEGNDVDKSDALKSLLEKYEEAWRQEARLGAMALAGQMSNEQ